MNWFSELSIRYKLVLIIMSITIMTLIITGVAITTYHIYQEKHEIFEENITLAKLIANRSTAALVFDDAKLANENLQALHSMHDINTACIYRTSGLLFAEYHRDQDKENVCPDLKNLMQDTAVFHKQHLCLSTAIKNKGKSLGFIFLRNNLASLNKQISEKIYITITFTILAGILAFLVTNTLQKIISTPLLRMTKIATEVESSHNYSLRTNDKGHDEVGQLGQAFNAMLETIEGQREKLINININLETQVKERTKELQAANNELEAFNYSVSHDLRAPLRSISGFSQIIAEDYTAVLDEQGKDLLKRVQDNTKQMNELIESLLTLSRLGRVEVKLTDVNLSEIADDIINLLTESEPERQLKFKVSNNLVTYGDPVLLKVVLINLLGNAWKYSSKCSKTEIEFGQTEIEGKKTFFVKDNGAGFNMKQADKLFAAFSRLHDKNEFPGTGIGLATVRRIISRHNGRIWAESQIDEGAVFYFILPDKGAV